MGHSAWSMGYGILRMLVTLSQANIAAMTHHLREKSAIDVAASVLFPMPHFQVNF